MTSSTPQRMLTRVVVLNETSFGIPTGSFPHTKKPIIPPDQKNKLLAMHRAGRVNAGIYVAIVLAIYLFLLTILLCRYSRKHRHSSEDRTGTHGRPSVSLCCGLEEDFHRPFDWIISLSSCCRRIGESRSGGGQSGSTKSKTTTNLHPVGDDTMTPPETIELVDQIISRRELQFKGENNGKMSFSISAHSHPTIDEDEDEIRPVEV